MNINKSGKYTVAVLLLLILTIACSKYEDGPNLSLISSKKRLSRDWKIEYTINISTGISHSADFDGWILSFKDNGSFTQNIVYNQVQENYSGRWEFIGRNQIKLEYTINSNNTTEFYTILRLTRKELWLESTLEEIHYYSD